VQTHKLRVSAIENKHGWVTASTYLGANPHGHVNNLGSMSGHQPRGTTSATEGTYSRYQPNLNDLIL
jgi:hypothetical protein